MILKFLRALWLVILIHFAGSLPGWGQQDTMISDADLERFTEVYLKQSRDQSKDENWLKSYFSPVGITAERYGEYIRGRIIGKEIELTSQETKGLNTILEATRIEETRRTEAFQKLCKSIGLSSEKYEWILTKFHTSQNIRNKINTKIHNKIEKE